MMAHLLKDISDHNSILAPFLASAESSTLDSIFRNEKEEVDSKFPSASHLQYTNQSKLRACRTMGEGRPGPDGDQVSTSASFPQFINSPTVVSTQESSSGQPLKNLKSLVPNLKSNGQSILPMPPTNQSFILVHSLREFEPYH